jgi:hypothetical protein
MKRRGFFGALAGLCLAPFAVKGKVKVKHVDTGINVVAYSKRRPDWKPPMTLAERDRLIREIERRRDRAVRALTQDLEDTLWCGRPKRSGPTLMGTRHFIAKV